MFWRRSGQTKGIEYGLLVLFRFSGCEHRSQRRDRHRLGLIGWQIGHQYKIRQRFAGGDIRSTPRNYLRRAAFCCFNLAHLKKACVIRLTRWFAFILGIVTVQVDKHGGASYGPVNDSTFKCVLNADFQNKAGGIRAIARTDLNDVHVVTICVSGRFKIGRRSERQGAIFKREGRFVSTARD